MRDIHRHISRQQFAFFICCVLLTALIYSKFALSVCMIALLVLGLIEWNPERAFPLRFNRAFGRNWRSYLRYRPYLALSAFFLLVLVGGFDLQDPQYWQERLRLKLPFLLFPFAFASIPPFSRRQYLGLFYFLLLLLSYSSIDVGIHYWQHFEPINQAMQRGQPIPTPMSHIRYSLLLALGVMGGAYLWWRGYYWRHPGERYLILGLTLFLFGFLHVLSVRSGLLTLYAAILLWSLYYVWRTGRIIVGAGTRIALLGLPLLAYQYVPSFRAKARYAIYDLERYAVGEGATYSDSERLHSLQLGIEIGCDHLLLGVGAGNLRREVHRRYAQRYPNQPAKMPHNQFVSVFAGSGLLGLLLFCLAFFYPLFYRHNYREPLFTLLHLVVLISFLMENTLETSIGVALYCTLLLVGLNYRSGKPGKKSAPQTEAGPISIIRS